MGKNPGKFPPIGIFPNMTLKLDQNPDAIFPQDIPKRGGLSPAAFR
jgi:hypothetical protein